MVGAKVSEESIRGGDLIDLCKKAEAPRCAAFVAADAQRVSDGSGVVVIAMGTREGSPVGYMVFDCSHDVEMMLDNVRKAAKDAFKDQPCTECES